MVRARAEKLVMFGGVYLLLVCRVDFDLLAARTLLSIDKVLLLLKGVVVFVGMRLINLGVQPAA